MFILIVLFGLIMFGAGVFVGVRFKDKIVSLFDKFVGMFKKED